MCKTSRIKTIDLIENSRLCVQFRIDGHVCSFPDGEVRFYDENGTGGERYLNWLSQRITEFPEGCVHLWHGDQVVGQLESRLRNRELGYLNFIYIAPPFRNTRFSHDLHDYLTETMASVGIACLELTVSRANERARAFYTKHGWRTSGTRAGSEDDLCMLLNL